MKVFFITGTDTGIGKTYVSTLLLKQCNAKHYKTFGIKPIASGCQKDAAGNLVNDDALALQAAASLKKPYDIVNPIALSQPVAPHIAAKAHQIKLSSEYVSKVIRASIQLDADLNLIEGVGGWSVPLNEHELVSDVISHLQIPVILVVGLKLGCLNHAILTCKNIALMGVPFVGWIGNCIDPDFLMLEENILMLKKQLPAPCLGIVPHGIQEALNTASDKIDAIESCRIFEHCFASSDNKIESVTVK